MEKFSGEGSFLFQNDSEPDLWGARFAKQGQVLQVGPIPRPIRCHRNWAATKVCQENWNFKGWGQKVTFPLEILIQNNLNPGWKAFEVPEDDLDWSQKSSLLK